PDLFKRLPRGALPAVGDLPEKEPRTVVGPSKLGRKIALHRGRLPSDTVGSRVAPHTVGPRSSHVVAASPSVMRSMRIDRVGIARSSTTVISTSEAKANGV